jgi:hypothetical protein
MINRVSQWSAMSDTCHCELPILLAPEIVKVITNFKLPLKILVALAISEKEISKPLFIKSKLFIKNHHEIDLSSKL